jgi:bifunctional non-homologous end joining protein LigD
VVNRAIAFKSQRKLFLRSRNDNDFARKYKAIAEALEAVTDETVIDGEVAAFDESGRPSFNHLQHWPAQPNPFSSTSSIY